MCTCPAGWKEEVVWRCAYQSPRYRVTLNSGITVTRGHFPGTNVGRLLVLQGSTWAKCATSNKDIKMGIILVADNFVLPQLGCYWKFIESHMWFLFDFT